MGPSTWILVAGGIVLLALVWGVGIYNRLVTLRNRFRNAFAQIDVQLTRRHDLIPNAVETVKGYAAHERTTLESVTRARAEAVDALARAKADPADAAAVGALALAERTLGAGLGRLFGLQEAYPDLKASPAFSLLFEELVSTENRIAFARQAFNDSAQQYNTAREVFPANLLSGALGFAPAALFEAGDAAVRQAPRVELG